MTTDVKCRFQIEERIRFVSSHLSGVRNTLLLLAAEEKGDSLELQEMLQKEAENMKIREARLEAELTALQWVLLVDTKETNVPKKND